MPTDAADERGAIASEDDPRVAEILRRRAAIHAAKVRHAEAGDPRALLGRDELDAIAPPLPRRSKAGAARKCPSCGHKINLFDGACHYCRSPQPTAADLAPVRPRPATPPEMIADAKEGPPMVDAPARDAPAIGSPCPDCGEPRNPANNRCYRCRPGGMVKRDGQLVPNTPDAAPGARRPRRAKATAPPPRPDLDPEIAAIQGCLDALAGLDPKQLGRVLKYVRERVED